jgi:hypothetical protein
LSPDATDITELIEEAAHAGAEKSTMEPSVPSTRPCPTTHRGLLGILSALLIVTAAPSTLAREDGAPAAALGTADAVRATAVGASGLYFNPAGMGIASQYAIEAGYSYSDAMQSHAVGAAAVDSKTNQAFALGVGYTFLLGQGEGNERDGHQIRAGLAGGWDFGGVEFRVGVGGRYLTLDRLAGTDPNFFTLDAGIILEVMQMFRIGLVGQNLIDTKTEYAPRQLGAGAAFTYEAFQASFDVNLDLQTDPENLFPQYSTGIQYLFGGIVVARAGVSFGGIEDHTSVAFGLGYISTSLAIDAGFSTHTDVSGGSLFSMSLRYFLP